MKKFLDDCRQQKEAQILLKDFNRMLEDEGIKLEEHEEAELKLHCDRLAGFIMSFWFPRAIAPYVWAVLIQAVLGSTLIYNGLNPLWGIPLLVIHSPRCIGELCLLAGQFAAGYKGEHD